MADVEINASLKSTAGKIIICAKNVINNSSLTAYGDCQILGSKLTHTAKDSLVKSLTGSTTIGGMLVIPTECTSGVHITNNLDKKIDIIK